MRIIVATLLTGYGETGAYLRNGLTGFHIGNIQMYLTVALLLLSATWVLRTWAYTAHRRPVPTAWTRYDAASIAVVITWVTLLAVGVGALVAAVISPIETLRDQTLLSAAVTLAAPVLAAKALPRLRASHAGPKAEPS